MTRHTLRQQIGMEVSRREQLEEAARDKVISLENSLARDREELKESEEVVYENFDKEEIVEACRTQLNFLAALAMPDVFRVLFSPTHLTIWSLLLVLEKDVENVFPQIALGIPRGHAKTTLLKLFILWLILYSERRFILVTASTEERAIPIIADVWDMLQEPNVKEVFGDVNIPGMIETDTKTLKKFTYRGRSIILMAEGAMGAVRGANIKNVRPDVIAMDDIQTKECAESRIQSDALESWMVSTLMKAKDQRRCMFIYAGNIFATPYSILKKLKTNPTWIKFISGAILADGTALWPEYRSLESLIQELNNDISMGQAHAFFSEVLNDVDAGANNTVDYSKFPEWPWTPDELPEGKFLVIDPSQGKGKDADVIAQVEVFDERPGVKKLYTGHWSPLQLIKQALIVAVTEDIYCIAVESTAYQSTLLFWFEHVCQETGISGISFVPIYTNSVAKNARISSGIKAMQTNELYLHDDVKPLVIAQIRDWNPMKRENTDDILDAISNVQKVIAEYPAEIMARGNLLLTESAVSGVVEDNHAF